MIDHLPECIYVPRNVDPDKGIEWGGLPCICAALRACEQRVLSAAWVAVGNVGVATATHGDDWRDRDPALVKRDALAAIDDLKEKP